MLCSHRPLDVKCQLWQELSFASVLLRCQCGLPKPVLHQRQIGVRQQH